MSYHPIVTHDIDRYFKWKKPKSIIGETWRILSNSSSWKWSEVARSFSNRYEIDPFSNLKMIADLDVKEGLDSVFYIMTTKKQHRNNINDYVLDDLQPELQEIIDVGVEIGIHPGVCTYDDPHEMKVQKERLEDFIGMDVKKSRQHYFKYEMPKTFEILSTLGIESDSSIYPTNRFDTYVMIDCEGNDLGLKQIPLVFMDTHHMFKKDKDILNELERSLQPAKDNGGEIMVLWHNNNISNDREIGLYREALQIIRNR